MSRHEPPAVPPGSARLTRRRALEAGAALALGLAGAVALVRTRGYAVPPGRRLEALSGWQLAVVQHAARRIAAPDRPGDAAIPTADAADVAGFFDAELARMPVRARRDMGRFLAYVEHAAPIAAGRAARFTRLAPAAQDAVLRSIEASSIDPLRAGFDGLKALVFMGYYRDPRTWGLLGYDGPLVGRPAGGWGAAPERAR